MSTKLIRSTPPLYGTSHGHNFYRICFKRLYFLYYIFLILYSSDENSTKKIHGIRKRCKCCIAIWSINTCPVTQKPCAEPYVTKVVGTAFFSYSIELVNDAVFIATQGRTLEYLVTWRDRKVLIRKGQQSFPMTNHMHDSVTKTA